MLIQYMLVDVTHLPAEITPIAMMEESPKRSTVLVQSDVGEFKNYYIVRKYEDILLRIGRLAGVTSDIYGITYNFLSQPETTKTVIDNFTALCISEYKSRTGIMSTWFEIGTQYLDEFELLDVEIWRIEQQQLVVSRINGETLDDDDEDNDVGNVTFKNIKDTFFDYEIPQKQDEDIELDGSIWGIIDELESKDNDKDE